MLEVDEQNFESETNSGIVLVDFYTTWCGPCRMMIPTLEKLTDVKVVKVNAYSNKQLAVKHNIISVPTFFLMKDGNIIERFSGLVTKEQIQTKIDAIKNN